MDDMRPDDSDNESAQVHGLDPWGLNQVEQLLLGISGVESLKLVPNGHGGVDEVHVLSRSDLSPKQVVRNIESALLAEFGLQIDHRKISVAQVEKPDIHPEPDLGEEATDGQPAAETQDLEPVASEGMRRLLLDALEIDRRAGDRAVCRVTLHDDDATYEGEAEGPDFSRSRLDVAARAVLNALNEATMEDVTLRLEGTSRVEVQDRELVVAVVQGQENRRSVPLAGVSIIEDSPEEASVLACLHATNRWAGAT